MSLSSYRLPTAYQLLLENLWPEAKPQLEARQEWAARSQSIDPSNEARLEIRNFIAAKMNLDLADLSNLSSPARLQHHSVSISHCPSAGGFALVRKPWSIGFDLETTSRVSSKVVARVSSPEELSQAPSAAHLWSAKETLFKSLFDSTSLPQPKTVSSLRVMNWSELQASDHAGLPLEEPIWLYRGFEAQTDQSIDGNGLIFVFSGVIHAFFIRAPQLRSSSSEE